MKMSTNLLLSALFLSVSLTAATDLLQFRSCRALKNYMVYNAAKRVGPWGLRNPGFCTFSRGPVLSQPLEPVALESDASSTSSARSPPVEGVDFSGTNVQVSGVDEPDIVKTDGDRVFVISGNKFFYVSVSSNGSSGKVVATLNLKSYPRDMLFDAKSNSVVIISQEYEEVSPLSSSTNRNRLYYPNLSYRPIIALTRISVADPKMVKISDKAYVEGDYISARSVDGTARLVFSYDGSKHIRFVTPGGKVTQQDATKKNIEIVKRSRLSAWLPTYNTTVTRCNKYGHCGKYVIRRSVPSCTSTFFPIDEFSGFSLLTVATFKLSGPLLMSGSSIAADGRTVYATESSLYAATTKYREDIDELDEGSIGRRFQTSFHKFELGKNTARYIATGAVSGSVLNQFSMHDYKGTFFVATTEGASWWSARDLSVSKVTSFRVSNRKLKKVGEATGLGKGERIYAVRYIKDVAYVVTFRQIDPLYVLDLSNPESLDIAGELKIPGYSAYLHPIAPGKILGVGQEATETGRTTGAKVSLFDVSVLTQPKQLSSWTLEGSYTSAEWEHKAFLWWGPENMAVLPISVYYRGNGSGNFIGAIALDVSDGEIKERGRISHGSSEGRTNWNQRIQRNFVIAKKNLWSMSQSQLQVNNIGDLKKTSSITLGDVRGPPGPILED